MKSYKRGIIFTFILMIIGALLIGGVTVAWFSSTAENTHNTFQSGTLNIKLDREQGNYYFEIENFTPGDQGTQLVVVSNTGSLDLFYQLNHTITGVLAEGEHPLEIQFLNSSYEVVDTTHERKLARGQDETLTIIWEMDIEAGNEYQGGTAQFDLHIMASQVSNASQTTDSLFTLFHQNSTKIIDRMVQHYQDHGHYGRSWGEFAFTDIGLSPADWSSPVGHLWYKPAGFRLGVKPAEGYQIQVQGINNDTYILTHQVNWSLWYDVTSQMWYFHSIQPENEIDVSTLVVAKRE